MTAPFDSLTRERATFYLIFTLFCIDNRVFLIICIIFPAIFFLKFLCLLNISLITIRNLRNHYSKPSFSIVLLNVDLVAPCFLPNTVDRTMVPPCLLPAVPFAQRTVIRHTVDLLRIKLNWNPNFQFAKVTSDSANLCISKFPHIELSLNFRNLVLQGLI